MTESSTSQRSWPMRLVVLVAVLGIVWGASSLLLARADGPTWVFHGGPFRSGDPVDFAGVDWKRLDALNELEMELVAEESSLTLWFSVYDGVPYVGCDLDCVGGRLTRWPQQIAKDDRVVLRLDGKLVSGRLVHVPHGTPEYAAARAARELKYAGDEGGRAAAETAAHGAVVGVGEALTGRAGSDEPGDRLYRVVPRPSEG